MTVRDAGRTHHPGYEHDNLNLRWSGRVSVLGFPISFPGFRSRVIRLGLAIGCELGRNECTVCPPHGSAVNLRGDFWSAHGGGDSTWRVRDYCLAGFPAVPRNLSATRSGERRAAGCVRHRGRDRVGRNRLRRAGGSRTPVRLFLS